jgi:hypothetical protein
MYRALILLLVALPIQAHQFTPTYPKLEQSFVPGVKYAKLKLLNKREEIEYYEISVFDGNWNKIPFATSNKKILAVPYLQTEKIEVYIKDKDAKGPLYICSKSKIRKGQGSVAAIASRICSKVKE